MRKIDPKVNIKYIYSICTLVSRMDEYLEMISSFKAAGFDDDSCEYLYIDNIFSNSFDGFSGFNQFLQEAEGKYIIICHQDIMLSYDNRIKLEQCIAQIEQKDVNWAILSNAGAAGPKNIVYRVTEPGGEYAQRGKVPSKVHSVDESFIVIKRSANLAVSSDLNGFHFYGTDLCLVASLLGYSSWVIDFNIFHKSKGKIDASFKSIRKEMIAKYNYFMRSRYIQTTNTNFLLSSNILLRILDLFPVYRFFLRQYFKWKFRKVRTDEVRTIV